MSRINPYCIPAYFNDESKRLYDVICHLSLGDLFLYKVKYLNDSDSDTYFEYALMKLTGERFWSDKDNGYIHDVKNPIAPDNAGDCYTPVERESAEFRKYAENELPELKIKIAAAGKDFDSLPVYELEYDNRNTVTLEDGTTVTIF